MDMMEALSSEILSHIFSFLHDGRDLAQCSAVCRVWRRTLADAGEEAWKALCIAYNLPPLNKALEKKTGEISEIKRKPRTKSTATTWSTTIRL
mmetsp:Transcript_22748/g.63264  ORF Transcript_22748/g.63264 Transcript_22748/m.63264 type:complete len:93 (+) Transcript_22748:55-333(+)